MAISASALGLVAWAVKCRWPPPPRRTSVSAPSTWSGDGLDSRSLRLPPGCGGGGAACVRAWPRPICPSLRHGLTLVLHVTIDRLSVSNLTAVRGRYLLLPTSRPALRPDNSFYYLCFGVRAHVWSSHLVPIPPMAVRCAGADEPRGGRRRGHLTPGSKCPGVRHLRLVPGCGAMTAPLTGHRRPAAVPSFASLFLLAGPSRVSNP